MSKTYFSIYADKFKLMRIELSDTEILDILSALSDLCLWGECSYTPQTPKQKYFWELVTAKFKEDDDLYNARSNAGKIGMLKRWEKQTDNKTDNKTDNQITNNKQQITSILNTQSSDKSSDCVSRKKLVTDDWFPKDDTVQKLKEKGLDAKKTVEKFINSCRAKNLKYIDFDRAILAWDWSKDASVKQNDDDYFAQLERRVAEDNYE